MRGSAGYFCAGLTDTPRFHVESNAGWGLADNMYRGSVVVGGNAGAIAGVAIRGAEVVIKGNMGSRAGQVMKEGTLLCCGNANFMAGYMMYGGRMIILGGSGERLGEDMTGGEIFLGGDLVSLGSDAMLTDTDEAEVDDVRAFLDRYRIPFRGSFRKIVNAGKKLRYGTPERQVRSIPYFNFSGASGYWNRKIQEDVYIKSQIGRYRVRGYGGARELPHLSDLAFTRDIPLDAVGGDPVSGVRMHTKIGGKNGANPLDLTMPVLIAPMSYGALSRSAKQAVAIASGMAGIAENTGEGGMSDAQRDAAGQLIFQMLGGRLGWNIHDMNRADGLEIYISQGAKPGFGGQLMAKKVTKETRRNPRHSGGNRPEVALAPPRYPGRRRSRDQGRGTARGDRLPVAGERQARRGAHPRRHQDRCQGRFRLRGTRRHAGFDRSRWRGGDGVCRHTDDLRHLRGGTRPCVHRQARRHRDRPHGRTQGRGRRRQGHVPGRQTPWRSAPPRSSPAAASPCMQCHVGQLRDSVLSRPRIPITRCATSR